MSDLIKRFRALLSYDRETGVLTWLHRPDAPRKTNSRFAGKVAGYLSPTRGYCQVRIDTKLYAAHRIAWMIVHGAIPDGMQIDHADGDPSNNRLANLRLATNQENTRNSRARCTNVSGVKGASFHRLSGLWRGRIMVDSKEECLGYFATAEEAGRAYEVAAKERFGAFARAT